MIFQSQNDDKKNKMQVLRILNFIRNIYQTHEYIIGNDYTFDEYDQRLRCNYVILQLEALIPGRSFLYLIEYSPFPIAMFKYILPSLNFKYIFSRFGRTYDLAARKLVSNIKCFKYLDIYTKLRGSLLYAVNYYQLTENDEKYYLKIFKAFDGDHRECDNTYMWTSEAFEKFINSRIKRVSMEDI